ncbi:flagellar hook-associated 2-like protein [Nostoc sp. HG1]|nr:flagellar hook-associated 2-like protein [Nostoc sp. HG1]
MVTSIANSLGFGSGIDTVALVKDLANASRLPKTQRFDMLAQANQAKISAVAQARSDLDGFSSSLSALVAGGTLQSQPSVSDAAIFDAKAKPGARVGAFSGQIEVTRLARGRTLASAFTSAGTNPVGVGTLRLTINAVNHDIAVTTANNSLDGLAAAFNASNSGVTASVVSDTGGVRLVLKGPTGNVNNFTVAKVSGPPTLDRYTSAQLTTVQTALDANFKVDGLAYTRPSNNVGDVVPGVDLTLKKAVTGTLVSMGVNRPTAVLKTTIQDFVSVYNELKTSLSAARTATGGDNALRTLDRQLSALVSQAVSTYSPNTLSGIGIKTNRDGSLLLDQAVFDRVVAANPDAVEAIFAPTRDATRTAITDPGIGGALDAIKAAAIASGGPLSGLTSRLSKEATTISANRMKMESREDAYRSRLERQFGGMDAKLGALKATQSYLDQQVKLWTQSGN